MNDFLVEKTVGSVDGPLVHFGLDLGLDGLGLAIPSALTRSVKYRNIPLTVIVHCRFSDDKLQATKVEIENLGSEFISTRDLMQLKLPAVMREIALGAIPNSRTLMEVARKQLESASSLKDNLALVAQTYWLEAVAWGTPRKTLMEIASCSRSTANEYISLAAKDFRLPKERTDSGKQSKANKP